MLPAPSSDYFSFNSASIALFLSKTSHSLPCSEFLNPRSNLVISSLCTGSTFDGMPFSTALTRKLGIKSREFSFRRE